MRDHERRNANRKSVLRRSRSAGERSRRTYPGAHGSLHLHAPRARRRARPAHRRARLRRQRHRPARGLRRLRLRRDPRRPSCARSSRSASAPTPRRARSRCSSRAPSASRRSPTIPARRGRCCPTSASSPSSRSRSRDALTRIGRLEGFAARRHRPGRRAVALSQQARVLVRHAPTTARSSAASTRPARGTRSSPVERLPAGLRALERRARAGRSPGVASRACRRSTAARTRACCATSSCARAGAPAQLQVRLVTGPGDLDGAEPRRRGRLRGADRGRAPTRSPRRRSAARRVSSPARRTLRGGALRPAASRSRRSRSFRRTPRWPSGSTAIAAELADLKGWERVYDLYCGIGTVGLSLAARAGEVWGLEIVEQAVADAIANAKRNEIDNAKFFAGDVRLALRELVEEASRPDVCIIDPPRAGLSQKVVRRIIEAAPRRIVYISCNPTTLAPERRAARRGRLRAARASCRSTCSRRRRTSSAWRCSSGRRDLAGVLPDRAATRAV